MNPCNGYMKWIWDKYCYSFSALQGKYKNHQIEFSSPSLKEFSVVFVFLALDCSPRCQKRWPIISHGYVWCDSRRAKQMAEMYNLFGGENRSYIQQEMEGSECYWAIITSKLRELQRLCFKFLNRIIFFYHRQSKNNS